MSGYAKNKETSEKQAQGRTGFCLPPTKPARANFWISTAGAIIHADKSLVSGFFQTIYVVTLLKHYGILMVARGR
jgi:hypothetical protein